MKLLIKKCIPLKQDATLEEIRTVWESLSNNLGVSYFLSWGWVRNWLISLPSNVVVWSAVLLDKDIPVCAFFLGENTIMRHKFLRSHSLFLNTVGIPVFDTICIEYNSMPNIVKDKLLFGTILEQIPFTWEELHLPALDAAAFPAFCLDNNLNGYEIITDKVAYSYYVDLCQISPDPQKYLFLLSANTRNQIKRSYKHYAVFGKISIEAADNVEAALNIFEELVSLHQNTWRKRSYSGAFANDYLLNFHKKLIMDRFSANEIQLLRISTGNKTIGCLYNFVYKKKVLFYQSGFQYESNPRLKPGYISHVEAIHHNARMGNSEYDFLVGDAQYKKSLATNKRKLIWARVQKPLAKFYIEEKLRNIKRYCLGVFKNPKEDRTDV